MCIYVCIYALAAFSGQAKAQQRAWATMASAAQAELLRRANAAQGVLQAASAEGQSALLLASQEQSSRLVELIGQVRPRGCQLIHLAQTLQQCSFSEACSQSLNAALASAASSVGTNAKWKPQSFEHFFPYMTEDVWSVVMSPDVDVMQKARWVFQLLIYLGLRQPSEGTTAYVTGLVVVAHEGAAKARSTSEVFLRDLFLELKEIFKGMKKAEPLEHVPELMPDVNDFLAKHPTTFNAVYAQGWRPCPSRVSWVDVSSVAKAFPWRSRDGSGKKVKRSACDAKPDPHTMMFQCMNMMMEAMGNRMENGARMTFHTGLRPDAGSCRSRPTGGPLEAAAEVDPSSLVKFSMRPGLGLMRGPSAAEAPAAEAPAAASGDMPAASAPAAAASGDIPAASAPAAAAAPAAAEGSGLSEQPAKTHAKVTSVAEAAKKVKQAMAAEATAKKAKKADTKTDNNGKTMEQQGKNNKTGQGPTTGKKDKGKSKSVLPVIKGSVKTCIRSEPSRSQLIAVFGSGTGSTKTFKYGKLGVAKAKAKSMAQGWLDDRIASK